MSVGIHQIAEIILHPQDTEEEVNINMMILILILVLIPPSVLVQVITVPIDIIIEIMLTFAESSITSYNSSNRHHHRKYTHFHSKVLPKNLLESSFYW